MFWKKKAAEPPKEEECEWWMFRPQPDMTAFELATIMRSISPGYRGYGAPIKVPDGGKSPEEHMGYAAGRHYVRMEKNPCLS